ncbi:hypothetical protein DET64_10716 [Marinobacter nauticus]|uniref:Uncharacterized protein n=1 Tax=Marinobacter nauticus TaxID=2743 RepID=A0A368UZ41_MARNT|nr:hypothetical protein DET64_10716 [Marinobacter nauticus]RCW33345.1 hypothetical protein DET51_10716 [Marinobacter nauticus]
MAAGRPFRGAFVATPRSPLCFGVKGLAPVFFGLVFGRGLAGCRQAENSPQFGNGFGG